MMLSSQNPSKLKTGFACPRGPPSIKKSMFSFEKLHSSSSTARSVLPNPNPKKRAAPTEDLRETKKKIMKGAPVKKVSATPKHGGSLKLKVTFRGIPVADLNLDAVPPSLIHTAAVKNQLADNIFKPQKQTLVNNARDLQKIVVELDKKRQREEKETAASLLKVKLEMERMQREKKQQQELEKKRQREERAALLREAQRKADAELKEKRENEIRQLLKRAKAAAVLREAQRKRDIELKEKQEVETRRRQNKQQDEKEKKRRVAEQRESERDAREKMEEEAAADKLYCCILKEIGAVKRCEHAWCWGYPSSTLEQMGLFIKEEDDGPEEECDELEEGEIREI